jgi:hypothetical protein
MQNETDYDFGGIMVTLTQGDLDLNLPPTSGTEVKCGDGRCTSIYFAMRVGRNETVRIPCGQRLFELDGRKFRCVWQENEEEKDSTMHIQLSVIISAA